MLERLKQILSAATAAPGAAGSPATPGVPEAETARLRVAAAVLLLEIAHADDSFSFEERSHIEEALARHFDLSSAETRQVLEAAEERRREAVDLHQFTSLINRHYDEGQRMVLAEILWRVVHADGELSVHEDALMRRLAGLLDLRPGYLAAARKRAVGEDPA